MRKKDKTVTRPSNFWWDVMFFVIIIPIFVMCLKIETDIYDYASGVIKFGGLMITSILTFFKCLLMQEYFFTNLHLKFKITDIGNERLHAQVLKSWFLFIFVWAPITTKYHSYKYENMFGAKTYGGYSTNVYWDTAEGARGAIKKYKKDTKEKRKGYFAKKRITKYKTIEI